MNQYDEMADRYVKIRTRDEYGYFAIRDFTLFSQLDSLEEKSVLDLACGNGYCTRMLKKEGARTCVGIDVSERMINLAREIESENPLGIKYICSSVETLDRLGDFDIVVGSMLLHYSENRDVLFDMCKAIYENTAKGGRFLGLTENSGHGARFPQENYAKYGLRFEALESFEEAAPMRATVSSSLGEVSMDYYYYERDVYDLALQKAGFEVLKWHGLAVPPTLLEYRGSKYWDFLIEHPHMVMVECVK